MRLPLPGRGSPRTPARSQRVVKDRLTVRVPCPRRGREHGRGREHDRLGLFPGDVAVVDKAKPPRNGCIVVACRNGDFTMKTYQRRGERVMLKAENPAFPNIEVRLRPTARCGASSPTARGRSEHGTASQPQAGTKTWNSVAL
ncbi:LexA family protein [Methylorubrum populi]|uniref:LexA family protein n=1 Tax=Methylorubrum populi TaxID=223967 RepID=UPI0009D7356A